MNPLTLNTLLRRSLNGLLMLLICQFAQAQGGFAMIADTADGGGRSGGTFFQLLESNGQEVPITALQASIRASAMRGADLRIVDVNRPVPAGKVSLRLHGVQGYAAPVQSIISSVFGRGVLEVSGVVEVEVVVGRQYIVKGVLDTYRREVWLEDKETGQVVGTKVVSPLDPALLKAMEGALFVCCNLRYDGNWIGETPFPNLPFVPAGARIKVLEFSRNEAQVLIDGRKMRIGNEHSRQQETIQQMMARLAVPRDPAPEIAAMEATVRDAIRLARVKPGMTREQVLLALGRPRSATTPLLSNNDWLYHQSNGEESYVVFGADGLVKEVDGSRKARELLLMPTAAASTLPPAAAATPNAAAPAPTTPPSAASAPPASAAPASASAPR